MTSGQKIRELAHRESIRELYAAYCFFVDQGRPDLFADAFTADGVLWLSDRGSFRGREEIAAHVGNRSGKLMHLIHNVSIVRIEEPRAWSHAYFQLIDPATGACAAYGNYDDVLTLEDDTWFWYLKKVIYQFQTPEYAAGVIPRPDFGQPLDGVPSFVENLLR